MRKIATLMVLAVATTMAGAFPKPASVPMNWELQFKFQPIQRIKVAIPGQGERTFWYVVYTVTNNTGKDVVFQPEFTVVTDALKVLNANINVAPEVFKAIQKQYKQTYPFLQHPRELIGKLGQGADNAKDSIAVWPDFSGPVSSFDLYVGGLSGEAIELNNPAFVDGSEETDANPKTFVLRKTLRIKYVLPSDSVKRSQVTAGLGERPAMEWVMR
jgi:hypothetical protein